MRHTLLRLVGIGALSVLSLGMTPHHSTRHAWVRAAFLKAHGLTHTPKGCQCDHRIPLHCHGPDTIDNLRLVCDADLKIKEHLERQCESPEFKEWLKWHP